MKVFNFHMKDLLVSHESFFVFQPACPGFTRHHPTSLYPVSPAEPPGR